MPEPASDVKDRVEVNIGLSVAAPTGSYLTKAADSRNDPMASR